VYIILSKRRIGGAPAIGTLAACLLAGLLAAFGAAPQPAKAQTLPSAKAEELLVVNKKTNELAYFVDGERIRVFPVATGKTEELTPEGVFPIVNKIKDRPYYKEKIPGGDPANPLGRRWLGLRVGDTEGTTYAIHGNNNEASIGKHVSAGCIRMRNDDIEWLFERIAIGTKVVIASSAASFEELAAKNGFEVFAPFAASVSVAGAAVEPPVPVYAYRGVTYVPLRRGFELLGGNVAWDAETGLATANIGERRIVHRPGEAEAEVDGANVSIAAPSRLVDGSVYVPLRAMASLAGGNVHWDAASRTIYLEP